MTVREAHAVLGLRPGSSASEARRAYRGLIRKLHPDLYRDPAERVWATERIRRVIEAYDLLERSGFPRAASGAGSASARGGRPPRSDSGGLRPGDVGARYKARWGGDDKARSREAERQAERPWRPVRTLWDVVIHTEAPLWQRLIGGALVFLLYGLTLLVVWIYLRSVITGAPPEQDALWR